jgi:protease IV
MVKLYLLIVIIAITLTVNCSYQSLIGPINLFEGQSSVLHEKYITYAEEVKDKILLINIDGEISDEQTGSIFSGKQNTVLEVKQRLDGALRDTSVKAIILKIDTPGGGGTASDLVYYELQEFKAIRKIPIVVWMVGMSTSGGYYISMASDHIIAHPTCITGSIGVIAVFPSIDGLLKKVGVNVEVVKSGKFKDSGSMFRKMTPDDKKIILNTINSMYDRFFTIVYENRKKTGISIEQLKGYADGKIFTAYDAKKFNLIDDIGYFNNAFAKAKELAKIARANLVTYSYKTMGRETIYSNQKPSGVGMDASQGLNMESIKKSISPQFLYMWIP